MSQIVERAKAVNLARKLMDQTTTRGCTEGQMDHAMKKLAQIQSTFNLTLNDIVLETLEYKAVVCEGQTAKGDPMSNVTHGISQFTDTKRWMQNGKSKYVYGVTPRGRPCMKRVAVGAPTYHFFGLESDILMAEFLFNLIKNSLDTACEQFMQSPGYKNLKGVRGAKRSALYSFKHAFTNGVSSRLSDMYWAEEREQKAARAEAGDLVLNKKSIRESKFDEVMGMKLVSRRSAKTGGNSMTGRVAGRESANNVNLSRPVSTSNTSRTLALA